MKEKHDFVTTPNLAKKYYPTKKQESLLYLGGCRQFSTPLAFYSSIYVNKFVDEWVKRKR